MPEKNKENVTSMTNFEKLMNNIASLDDERIEKVSLFVQGMMAMRDMRDKKQITAQKLLCRKVNVSDSDTGKG